MRTYSYPMPKCLLRAFASLTFCALALQLARPLDAQKNMGELRISVKDATGAALTATVRIENQAAKIRQEIHLPADGRFAFRNLPFGHYAVTASREGFTPAS